MEFVKEELIFVMFIKDINKVVVTVFVDSTGGSIVVVVVVTVVIRGVIVNTIDDSKERISNQQQSIFKLSNCYTVLM